MSYTVREAYCREKFYGSGSLTEPFDVVGEGFRSHLLYLELFATIPASILEKVCWYTITAFVIVVIVYVVESF